MPARSGVRQTLEDRVQEGIDHRLGARRIRRGAQTFVGEPLQAFLVQHLTAPFDDRRKQFLLAAEVVVY